jgi:hypothetical protein
MRENLRKIGGMWGNFNRMHALLRCRPCMGARGAALWRRPSLINPKTVKSSVEAQYGSSRPSYDVQLSGVGPMVSGSSATALGEGVRVCRGAAPGWAGHRSDGAQPLRWAVNVAVTQQSARDNHFIAHTGQRAATHRCGEENAAPHSSDCACRSRPRRCLKMAHRAAASALKSSVIPSSQQTAPKLPSSSSGRAHRPATHGHQALSQSCPVSRQLRTGS